MANDSTPIYLQLEVKNKKINSPRRSSIIFLQQFARLRLEDTSVNNYENLCLN